MTAHQARQDAWGNFLRAYPANLAVTLALNPHRAGTASECMRIKTNGEHEFLGNPYAIEQNGTNYLPEVYHISLEKAHFLVDRFHRIVDRDLFGSHYNRRPAEKRSKYIGFAEHENSNLHVHLLWSIPEERIDDYTLTATQAWSAMVPRGSIRITVIQDEGWANYICKDQWGDKLDGDPMLFFASRSVARN